MDDKTTIILNIIKCIFFIAIPIGLISAIIKKKIKTRSAIGLIGCSCFIGIMAMAAVVKVDPVDEFMHNVNLKNYEETKRSFKILVQFGPAYLQKIDYNEIIDPVFFQGIKNDTASEYRQIVEKYYKNYTFAKNNVSSDISVEDLKDKLSKLKHALTLIELSEFIDAPMNDLKLEIQERVVFGESLLEKMQPKE